MSGAVTAIEGDPVDLDVSVLDTTMSRHWVCWHQRLVAGDAGIRFEGTFGYWGAGTYVLEAVSASPDAGISVATRLPIRSSDERAQVTLLLHRPSPTGPVQCRFLGEVTESAEGLVGLEVLEEPSANRGGRFRLVPQDRRAKLAEPFPWVSIVNSKTREHVGRGPLCPAVFRSRPGGSSKGLSEPFVIDEAQGVCQVRPLPAGDYDEQIELADVQRPGVRQGNAYIFRAFRLSRALHVDAGEAALPRHVFETVPAQELRVAASYRDVAELAGPDGGVACVCRRTLVGREQIPVVDVDPTAVVLEADGGDLMALRAPPPLDRDDSEFETARERLESDPERPPATLTQEATRLRHGLNDFHGHVVLLNFWADWCQPCMMEIPRLMRIGAEYGRRALFVAVYYGAEEQYREEVREWISKKKTPFSKQIAWGNDTLLEQFPHPALPTTYVLGCDGKTLARFKGAIFDDAGEARLRAAIEKGLASEWCNDHSPSRLDGGTTTH